MRFVTGAFMHYLCSSSFTLRCQPVPSMLQPQQSLCTCMGPAHTLAKHAELHTHVSCSTGTCRDEHTYAPIRTTTLESCACHGQYPFASSPCMVLHRPIRADLHCKACGMPVCDNQLEAPSDSMHSCTMIAAAAAVYTSLQNLYTLNFCQHPCVTSAASIRRPCITVTATSTITKRAAALCPEGEA